jgi:hypothetical protein
MKPLRSRRHYRHLQFPSLEDYILEKRAQIRANIRECLLKLKNNITRIDEIKVTSDEKAKFVETSTRYYRALLNLTLEIEGINDLSRLNNIEQRMSELCANMDNEVYADFPENLGEEEVPVERF